MYKNCDATISWIVMITGRSCGNRGIADSSNYWLVGPSMSIIKKGKKGKKYKRKKEECKSLCFKISPKIK